MYIKIQKFFDSYFVGNKSIRNRNYYLCSVFPLLIYIPILLKLRIGMLSVGVIWVLFTILEDIFKRLSEENIVEESCDSVELENSEINEMLSYRFTPKVIVPIVGLDKHSISALRLAKTISNDVTIFGICHEAYNREEVKENLKLLDVDIKVEIRYLTSGNATEQLLEFIESYGCNYIYGNKITVVLPRSALYESLGNLFQDKTKLYIKQELEMWRNIMVITMP